MKGFGPGEFARQLGGERLHVEEVRKRALRIQQQREADAFVEEYQAGAHKGEAHHHGHVHHEHADQFVDEFSRFDGRPPSQLDDQLERAFEQYLHSGIVVEVGFAARNIPPRVLMDRAVSCVALMLPHLPPGAHERKAVEMLHNLDLDECHGRPHPGAERFCVSALGGKLTPLHSGG
jgi:hypothetical protein